MKNNKSLGQHWLKDREILAGIAGYGAEVADDKTVALEIGPGLGTLTSALLRRFKSVIAVEFDERLAAKLPKQFVGANLEVINADFLTFDLTKMQNYGEAGYGETGDYVVVANIPYYITAKIIQKLVEAEHPPRRAVLLVQKEVAERITAGAGDGGRRQKSSLLSLMVACKATARLGMMVGREKFTPPPEVDSQVLILDFDGGRRLTAAEDKRFWKVARAGFRHPRKKLRKNLLTVADEAKVKYAFRELKVAENARAEDLDFAAWKKLATLLG